MSLPFIIGLGLALAAQQTFASNTCTAQLGGAPCQTPGSLNQNSLEPSLNLGGGNPVHLATGNKYQYETDLVPSPHWPMLAVARHYSAQSRRKSFMGQGWHSDYDLRLQLVGQQAVITQADGSMVRFDSVGGQFAASERGQLHANTSGWAWRWPGGQELGFNAQGWLVSVRWPNGGQLRISRHTQDGALLGAVEQVSYLHAHPGDHTATPSLRFAYLTHNGRAYLQSIDSPVGRFLYTYEGVAAHLRLKAMQRPDGSRRQYLYEPALQSGNPYAMTGIVSIAAPPQEGRFRRGQWAYNAANQVVQFTHSGQVYKVNYQRPGQGRLLTRLRSERGAVTDIHMTGQHGRHRLTAVTGAACPGCPAPGTRASYDRLGRLQQVNGTSLARHANGRLRSVTPAHAGWAGLSLHYDQRDKRHAWQSALTGHETMVYDAQGLPLRRQFADGGYWHYTYDAAGRPIHIDATNADESQQTQLGWERHQLTHIEHPAESETRRHDAHGRMVERTLRRPQNGEHQATGPSLTEHFFYDEQHRLTRHALAEGGALHYRWGSGRQLLGLVWENAKGVRHTVITSSPGVYGYRYGNDLQLTTLASRHTAWLVLSGNPKAARAQRYQFNDRGQVKAEQIFSSAETTGQTSVRDWAYTYNRHAQLIMARLDSNDAATEQHWYAYDDNGATMARQHQRTLRPTIRRGPGGLPQQVDALRVVYGPDRRLKHIWQGTQLLARYTHNAFGQRIGRSTAKGDTHYWYLNRRLVAESRPASPAISRRYLYANEVAVGFIDYTPKAAAESTTGQLYFVHADLNGAPRWVSDAQQFIRWEADYLPYGKAVVHPTSSLTFNLRAPGQYVDNATGWHDNLLRTYDPSHGHYLEPDPLGPIPGNQALGYASQQPRRFVDPLGLLLFAFDGTRNDATTHTNVWKLSQRYQEGQVFYQAGPGNPYSTDWDAITAYSAPRIVDRQWQALLDTLAGTPTAPNQAVPIDIIGYSRGAALARHFGNQVSQYVSQGQFSYHDLQRGLVTACVDLRFMGLFDTVAQFGLNGQHNVAFDLTIDAGWQWVAHAIALHERRWLFPLASSADSQPGNVVEAPFIGAHADIGGGVLTDAQGEPNRRGDLSDISLNWMLWQARAASVAFGDGPAEDTEVSAPYLHDDRSSTLRTLQNGDRRLDRADGSLWHNYQNDHHRLGSGSRAATEAFITRYDDWRRQAGNEVGTVDMAAYTQWLDATLALPPPRQ